MRNVPLLLLLPLLFCHTGPIPIGKPPGTGKPIIEVDSKAVVFTLLIRSISVARSQGIPWYIELKEEDAAKLKKSVYSMLKETLQFKFLSEEKVHSHELYRAGRFPLREQFFLNPGSNPIAATTENQDLMLRMGPVIGAKYFIVMVLDHSTSKVLLKPSSVTAAAQIQIFTPEAGLIYAAGVEESADALPYDRDMPISEFKTKYREVLNSTCISLIAKSLVSLKAKMKGDFTIIPQAPEHPVHEKKDEDTSP